MKRILTILLMAISTCLLNAQDTAAPKDGVSHVDAAGAKKLIDEAAAKKNSNFVVLDVRTPEEYKAGHIAGAVNVDFKAASFADEVAKLDKSKTYVVHCRSGGRSTSSLETFKKLGFKSIVHLDGGFAGWEKAKLPVAK